MVQIVYQQVLILLMELGYDTVELSSTERQKFVSNDGRPTELLIETVQTFSSLTNFSNITRTSC